MIDEACDCGIALAGAIGAVTCTECWGEGCPECMQVIGVIGACLWCGREALGASPAPDALSLPGKGRG